MCVCFQGKYHDFREKKFVRQDKGKLKHGESEAMLKLLGGVKVKSFHLWVRFSS
jgi:hypothetical protein